MVAALHLAPSFTSPRLRGAVDLRANASKADEGELQYEHDGDAPSSGSRLSPLATFSPQAVRRKKEGH